MAEEVKIEEQQNDSQKYIDAINELKATSVPKEEADRLRAENKQLLDALAKGETLGQKKEKEKPDLEKLKKAYEDTFGTNGNLAPCKAALEYRNAVLEEEGYDMFIPNSRLSAKTGKYQVKEEDAKSAQRVADLLQGCIDDCNGSDQLFTSLLKDRTYDDPTFLRAVISRNKK